MYMEELEMPKKRIREEFTEETETETEIVSTAVKRLREDLLDTFDDEFDEVYKSSYNLDSFMKSFEDEIKAGGGEATKVADLASEYGESAADLGYLLGASDGELGIRTSPRADVVAVNQDSLGFDGGLFEIPGCGSAGQGFGDVENGNSRVVQDLLFDYPDPVFGSDNYTSELEPLLEDLFEIYSETYQSGGSLT